MMRSRSLLQRVALTPKQWMKLSQTITIVGSILFLITMPLLLRAIYKLPYELTQGIHIRMLFLHVPAAFCSLASYSALAVMSGLYLVWNIRYCLWGALSLLYPCAALTLLTLITGSLWGAPTWGTYWIWDARLTSSFVLLLTLIVLITIDSLPTPNRTKLHRIFCMIALLGWMNIPFVHFSVEWFHTLHQGASLSVVKGSSLDTPYLIVLLMAIVHTSLWLISSTFFLFYQRIRSHYGLH